MNRKKKEKRKKRKKKGINFQNTVNIGPVWFVCLKTENCYLKIFVEIRVGEKVC